MNLTSAGLGPLLRAAPPADRRRFARACVRHALSALPTDARSWDLAALLALPDAGWLARWQAVPRPVWGTGGLGPARRAVGSRLLGGLPR